MELVHTEQSEYQHIMIMRDESGTYFLSLDGFIQTTLPNEKYYQTILGPNFGMKTSILGGGDLTGIATLKQRGITDWTLFEIDEKVINACIPFCTIPEEDWRTHIRITDAMQALRSNEAAAEHIVIDMLAMSRLSALTDISANEFIDIVCAQAEKVVSGFTATETTGIMLNTVLKNMFSRNGFSYFCSLRNMADEVFFIAAKDPFALPKQLHSQVIQYPIYPKSDELYDLDLESILVVLGEAQ